VAITLVFATEGASRAIRGVQLPVGQVGCKPLSFGGLKLLGSHHQSA